MSILRNFPVVLGQRQIGLLQSVSLNEAQNQVLALIVSCGIRGKRVILPESVEAIGKGFVVVRGVQRYKRKYEASPCSFVRDASGLLCGRVTDYALDDETFAVQAFEMSPGYLGKARRTRLWIYDYRRSESHAEELIIPALLGMTVGAGLMMTPQGKRMKRVLSKNGSHLARQVVDCWMN